MTTTQTIVKLSAGEKTMPKILFIDLEALREKFEEALLKAGFQVEVHISSGTAAKIIDGGGGELKKFDLFITEHFVRTPTNWTDEETELGTRTGRAVVRRVHAVRPEVPIIILTHMNDHDERDRNKKLPNVWFFRKEEISPEMFVRAVQDICKIYGI